MQNKIFLSLLVLICSVTINYAQNIDNSKRTRVTYDLSTNFNIIAPRTRIGVLKNLNERWIASVDVGYGNHNMVFSRAILGKKYQLWEVRSEIYRINNPNRKTPKYFSAEIFFINHKDIFNKGSFGLDSDNRIQYERANYQRIKYGLNIKYGFLVMYTRRIGLNFYTGFGVRVREDNFYNIKNPEIIPNGQSCYILPNSDTDGIFKNIKPNFCLGFKILF